MRDRNEQWLRGITYGLLEKKYLIFVRWILVSYGVFGVLVASRDRSLHANSRTQQLGTNIPKAIDLHAYKNCKPTVENLVNSIVLIVSCVRIPHYLSVIRNSWMI